MGKRRKRKSSSDSTTSTSSGDTTTTTTTSSMDGGGMGGMNNVCYVYPSAPATPGRANPDVVFRRSAAMNGSVRMDDGRNIAVWGFLDGDQQGGMGGMGGTVAFPSPAMRVRQGQIVHTILDVGMMNGVHTIHHHGIEPHYASDGVGHLSWDVSGTYTYQWRPMSAGTYFYHCHTNTVLHAEMGMYGALIVDPPEGPGKAFRNGPSYDVEAFWVVDEFDSSWHTLDWTAGTCGQDVGLHDLNPDYFIITGVDGSGNSAMDAPPISATIDRGDTVLARYICAGYHPQEIRFGGLTGTVVASDGRPLPKAIEVTKLRACSGERYDIIFKPSNRGTYVIETDIIHWITGKVLGTTRTSITVQ